MKDMFSSVATVRPYAADFDPLTAPQEELKQYGIPRRPDPAISPHGHRLWVEMFRKKPQYVAARWVEDPKLKRIKRPAELKKVAAATYNEPYWSGAGYLNPPSGVFTSVGAAWDVPAASAQNSGFGLLSWVGIDGWGTNAVCQIGTWHEFDDAGKLTVKAWWEWFPDPSRTTTDLDIAPGDAIGATVTGHSANSATLTIANMSKNKHTSIDLTPPAGNTFQGQTAEWILERPSGTTPLCTFQPCGMALASADYADALGGATKGSVWAKDGDLMNMVNSSNQTLATAGIGTTLLGPAIAVTFVQAQ
jgi:hypothetical protein